MEEPTRTSHLAFAADTASVPEPTAPAKQPAAVQGVTASDALTVLAEEWRFRHELFWKSLYRWGGAIVALWVAPFLRPEILKTLQGTVLALPFIGVVLSVVAAWHLNAEYSRLVVIRSNLEKLLVPYNPKQEIAGMARHPIGRVVPRLFGYGMTVLSVAAGAVVWWLLHTLP